MGEYYKDKEIMEDVRNRRKIEEQKETIKQLVWMVDQLRGQFNGGRRHDIYVDFTEQLNKLQEEGKIEH
jgi:hypothetical protein